MGRPANRSKFLLPLILFSIFFLFLAGCAIREAARPEKPIPTGESWQTVRSGQPIDLEFFRDASNAMKENL